MHQKDHTDFELLKKKIVETMQISFPGISSSIAEWKGQDIVNFQEELLQKVNAHISEKWFYTHMKSEKDSLPRIDVLNLLSKYVGYADWNDFVFKNGGKVLKPAVNSGNRYFIIVPVLAIGVLGLFLLLNNFISTREYSFCFYDADTKEPISNINTNTYTNINTKIEVSIILENESPVNYLCRPDGCFTLKTDQSYIKMVVNSPYYRNDTIRRTLKKFNQQETIKVKNLTQDCDTVLYYPDTVLTIYNVGIKEENDSMDGFGVKQNYPNPSVDETSVRLYLPRKGLKLGLRHGRQMAGEAQMQVGT